MNQSQSSPFLDITIPNLCVVGDSAKTSQSSPLTGLTPDAVPTGHKVGSRDIFPSSHQRSTNFSGSSNKTSRDNFSVAGDGSPVAGTAISAANYSPESKMNTVIGAPTTATTTTNVSPHSNSTMTPLNTMNTILSMATPPPTPFRSDAGGTPAQPNGNNGIAAVVIVVNNEIGGDSISSKESSGLLGELLVAKVITNVPAHLAAMRASSSFSPLGSGAATSGLDDTTAGTSTQTATTANTRHKQSPSTLLPTEDVTATASLIVSANSPFDQSRNLNSTTNVCVAPNNSLASATMPPTSNKYANPFHPPAFYQPQQPSDRFTASVGGLNSQLQQNGGGGNNNASTRSNNASGLLASMTAINNENGSFGGGGMSVTVGTGNGSLLAQFFPASTTDRPLSASATAFTPPVPRTGLVPHVHVDPTIQNRFQYNNSTSVASVGGNNNTANNLKASVSNSSTTLGKTNNGHGNNNNKSNSPLAGTKGSNAEDSIEVYAPDSKIVYTVPKELVSHFGTEPTGGKRMICRSYSNAYASSHELPQGLSATDNSLRDGGATSPASKKSSQSNNTSINNNSSDPNLVVTNIGGGTCQMGSNCKFVHIDALLSSLKMDEVHVHYIWRDIECVTYERLNSVLLREHPTLDRSRVMNTVLRIFGPNHREPAEEVSTANLLYTKGSRYAFEVVAGIIPTAGPHPCHCAHYYFNQVCNRGASCAFIHSVSIGSGLREDKFKAPNFHRRVAILSAEEAHNAASRGPTNKAPSNVGHHDYGENPQAIRSNGSNPPQAVVGHRDLNANNKVSSDDQQRFQQHPSQQQHPQFGNTAPFRVGHDGSHTSDIQRVLSDARAAADTKREAFNEGPAPMQHNHTHSNGNIHASGGQQGGSDYHQHLQSLINQLQQHLATVPAGPSQQRQGGIPSANFQQNGYQGQHQQLQPNPHIHTNNNNNNNHYHSANIPASHYPTPAHPHHQQNRHPSQDGFDIGQFSLGAMGMDGSTSGDRDRLGGNRGPTAGGNGSGFGNSTNSNNMWASTPQQRQHGLSSPNTPLARAALMQQNMFGQQQQQQRQYQQQQSVVMNQAQGHHYQHTSGTDDGSSQAENRTNILDFFTKKPSTDRNHHQDGQHQARPHH